MDLLCLFFQQKGLNMQANEKHGRKSWGKVQGLLTHHEFSFSKEVESSAFPGHS